MAHRLSTPDGRLIDLNYGTFSVQPLCEDTSIESSEKITECRTCFHDEYDVWQFEKTAERGKNFTDQEHVNVLGWYLLCSGDVVCEVKDKEQGDKAVDDIAYLIEHSGRKILKVEKLENGDITVRQY